MSEEVERSLQSAYKEVNEKDVLRSAYVIGSHIIYKIKREENGKRLNARLCRYGSQDCEKGFIWNDPATAQINVIKLLLSLTTVFEFMLPYVDVKEAYLQSGEISRKIYVRPPPEIGQRYVLWKLRKVFSKFLKRDGNG